MIKLLDLLKEEDSPFVSRGGKERVEAYSLKRKVEAENKIQQYIKNGMKGNLNLRYISITSLPDDLTRVGGFLDLSGTKITSLPSNLTKVKGDLSLYSTPITSLPKNLTVGGFLDLYGAPITSLPDNLSVKGNLNIYGTKITSLPDNLNVGGNLSLKDTPLSKKYSKEEIKAMVPNVKGEIYI
ncbi:hypothetical protein UFOVP331_191 [uncultured Caudovirales phage]|uniref:Leucine-rich repeat n=1 Tax=uncultured Caudovirales phage TaxID=2100421 RepID=A0A6J5LX18_9CAUD|nr:hypothetical protein UFOVP331_191 [uncultured Caudovirales phage]